MNKNKMTMKIRWNKTNNGNENDDWYEIKMMIKRK